MEGPLEKSNIIITTMTQSCIAYEFGEQYISLFLTLILQHSL